MRAYFTYNFDMRKKNVMKLGVALSTRATRPQYLAEAIESVMSLESAELYLGVPKNSDIGFKIPENTHVIVFDEEYPLAAKLQRLTDAMDESIEFVCWIGDDDLLYPEGTLSNLNALARNVEASAIFGNCDYIDVYGRKMFTTPWARFAKFFLKSGPNLLPQPASLIRRSALQTAGGFGATDFQAHDYDLFLRLAKIGPLVYKNTVAAAYRWHPDSMTVKNRLRSAVESSRVRFANRSRFENIIFAFLEPFVILSTYLTGKYVGTRYKVKV